jgi:hypothetical protein
MYIALLMLGSLNAASSLPIVCCVSLDQLCFCWHTVSFSCLPRWEWSLRAEATPSEGICFITAPWRRWTSGKKGSIKPASRSPPMLCAQATLGISTACSSPNPWQNSPPGEFSLRICAHCLCKGKWRHKVMKRTHRESIRQDLTAASRWTCEN